MRRVLISPLTEAECPAAPRRRRTRAAEPSKGLVGPVDESRAWYAPDAPKYRCQGEWKLAWRICSRDVEGKIYNGYSDKV